ncbi:MAG: hypothetical protein LQ339_001179 [Xanthoria mediterranea]|nr:MAG: hypothetical protein LQ339_001179 [Xanthoria mediterranea]
MVATRNHPTNFPPPDLSQSKASATRARSAPTYQWIHTPKALTLLWLIVSLPLVVWDTGYVVLRPHSMPGGKWHRPFYTPYALYGTVDYVYGWPAYESGDGFTMAQSGMNVLETIGYLGYLYIFWMHGEGQWVLAKGQRRSIGGGWGGLACLLGFALSILTFSKTMLYALNEHFSDYRNIGHNSFSRLVFLYIIPNGAWIILPAYMIYAFGTDILQGLSIAGGDQVSKPARATKLNSTPPPATVASKRSTPTKDD